MKRIFFFLLIGLWAWTGSLADTLTGDGFRIEYTVPDGWLSSTRCHQSELEDRLGLPEGTLKLIADPPGTTKLYYPVNGTYSPDNAIRMIVKPMESYHKNYSGFDETQLGNIAASFMQNGTMDAYQTVRTTGGAVFLQLHHMSADDLYAVSFVTNENGATFRADVPASANQAQVLQWLESIAIHGHRNSLPNLIIRYWYYPFMAIFILGGIMLRQKKTASGR